SVKKAAPWTPSWKPISPNITARSAAIFTTPRTCCWPSAIATSQRLRAAVPKTPLTVDADPTIMIFSTVLFYLLALVLAVAALRVITATSPVTGVLHLILVFFNASMIWMLQGAEFLALLLVVVYVGAVMVLFLF